MPYPLGHGASYCFVKERLRFFSWGTAARHADTSGVGPGLHVPLLFSVRVRVIVGMTPAGLEPAIPGSVGRCLIHWATGPDAKSLPVVQSAMACPLRMSWLATLSMLQLPTPVLYLAFRNISSSDL